LIDYSSPILLESYPQENPGVGPRHPAPAVLASMPLVAAAFEEAAASQAAKAS